MPRCSISRATSSIERTTPLICGCQASVTMRTDLGRSGIGLTCEPALSTPFPMPGKCRAGKQRRAGSLRPFGKLDSSQRLTRRELEGLAGLGLAVLLALDDAAVAGKEATLLEHGAQLRLEIGERLGDAVAHRPGLPGKTAAGNRGDDVILVLAGHNDRSEQ